MNVNINEYNNLLMQLLGNFLRSKYNFNIYMKYKSDILIVIIII